MRRALVTCIMVVASVLVQAEEVVLWWQVPDDPAVTTFHEGIKSASELGADNARVLASNGDYLVIPPPDQVSLEIPMDGAWFALLPSSPEGLSFMVELGNWENGKWVGVAQSRSYTYAELHDYIIRNWGGPDAIPAIAPLIADGYVVPEPSSGVMLLIGAGLLALRRKRKARL